MPTQLNSYIKSVELHYCELVSDLQMIIHDLEKFVKDSEAMSKIALDEEGMRELIEDIKEMSELVTSSEIKINNKLVRLIQKESMADFKNIKLKLPHY